MILLIVYFKSLTADSTRQALNCLHARTLLVQVTFCDFNVDKLLSLAKLYPHDFDSDDLRDLSNKLGLYIFDVRDDDRFSSIQTIAKLFQETVETRKHERYQLDYRLLKLVLVLSVFAATVREDFLWHEDCENEFA